METGEDSEEVYEEVILCSAWDYFCARAVATKSESERKLAILLGQQFEGLFPEVKTHAAKKLAELSLTHQKEEKED